MIVLVALVIHFKVQYRFSGCLGNTHHVSDTRFTGARYEGAAAM